MAFNGTGRLKPRHFKILIRPLLITAGMLMLWYTLRSLGIYQTKDDTESTTNSLIPILVAFYGFVAALIIVRVMDDDILIHKLVAAKRVRWLHRKLKERIHPIIHIVMMWGSFWIMVSQLFLRYESVWTGVEHIAGTTSILALYWSATLALDNPLSMPGVRDVIPEPMIRELERLDVLEAGEEVSDC